MPNPIALRRSPFAPVQAEPLEHRLLLAGDVEPTSFNGSARFVENRGQWDDAIVLAAHGEHGASVLFTEEGATIRLIDYKELAAKGESGSEGLAVTEPEPLTVDAWDELTLTFPGARCVIPRGVNLLPTVHNYYLGDDPSRWAEGVRTYASVIYEGLWEGVDLYAHARPGGMKYEFHVAPGADPSQVHLRYDGHDAPLRVGDDGRLVIETAAGELTDATPLLYQADPAITAEAAARGVAFDPAAAKGLADLPGRFELLGDGVYTLALDVSHDPSRPLVLDPDLAFAGYLGGSGYEVAHGIVSDGEGGAWVAGYTTSADLPTPGGFDPTFNGSSQSFGGGDALVARVNEADELAYATYFGGALQDVALDVVGDGAGGVWFGGYTRATDLPTVDGFDSDYNGGDTDAFIARLTSDGSLTFSSYYGGSGADRSLTLAEDGGGGAWLAGDTASVDLPTPDGFDATYNGGTLDGFIARVAAGGTLVSGSFFGGAGTDYLQGLTADDGGGVWTVGTTYSDDLPMAGGFDNTRDGTVDAYIARFTSGGALVFASYFGGSGVETAEGVDTDGAGGVWLTGLTTSPDLSTPGGFDTTFNTGSPAIDGYVARVSAGDALAFASYLGGSGQDRGADIASDGVGGAWVWSETSSSDLPTPNAFNATFVGEFDGHLSRVTASGDLVFGTYLGGAENEFIYAAASDGAGGVWLASQARSDGLPTPNGFDEALTGTSDAYIVHVAGDAGPQLTRAEFEFDARQAVALTFDRDVAASIDAGDLQIQDVLTGQTLAAADVIIDIAELTATFMFGADPLPDGNYRATLPASSVTDELGNPLPEDVTLDFFVLAGDANRDRVVSLADFLILRSNFGHSGKVFSEGDFNYDGQVNLADFLILRGNFGESLPPPVGAAPLPGLFSGGGKGDDGDGRRNVALLH